MVCATKVHRILLQPTRGKHKESRAKAALRMPRCSEAEAFFATAKTSRAPSGHGYGGCACCGSRKASLTRCAGKAFLIAPCMQAIWSMQFAEAMVTLG